MNIKPESAETVIAVEMSEETIEACQAINNTLTVAEVKPHFQAHYANAKTDVCGIMALIKDILRQAQAEFPRGAENTELRNIVIAASLFTSDILKAVQDRFTAGSTRYPLQTIKNCLSTYGKGEIAKIQFTGGLQDPMPRPTAKPRCKWYLILKQD